MSDHELRRFDPADTDACCTICLRTGDRGRDATGLYRDPRLIGEVFVGPYLARWPDFAFVVVDADGVAGYVVGAPDTSQHEQWLDDTWYPPLRRRYPLGSFPAGTADEWCVGIIHEPTRTDRDIVGNYPAHLHIDLLERVQGRGVGRRLMDIMLATFRDAGVGGAHLGVSPENVGAIAFYERLGFHHLGGSMWGRSTDPLPSRSHSGNPGR